MDKAERRMYGIPEGAKLVEECLNDERVRYLEQRINDHNKIQIAKSLKTKTHKASKRVHDEFFRLAQKHNWLK